VALPADASAALALPADASAALALPAGRQLDGDKKLAEQLAALLQV